MTAYRLPAQARPFFGSAENGLWGKLPWARSERIDIPLAGLVPRGLQRFPLGSGLTQSAAVFWEACANIDSDGPSPEIPSQELAARDPNGRGGTYWKNDTKLQWEHPWLTADHLYSKACDSRTFPGIVIPPQLVAAPLGLRAGDVALVTVGDVPVACQIYDIGPHTKIGEMSVALAERLGIGADPRRGNDVRNCCYLAFPGTRPGGRSLAMEPGEIWIAALDAWNRLTGRTTE